MMRFGDNMNEDYKFEENEKAEEVSTDLDINSDSANVNTEGKKSNNKRILKGSLALITLSALILAIWGFSKLVLAGNNGSTLTQEPETAPTILPSPQVIFNTPIRETTKATENQHDPVQPTNTPPNQNRTEIITYTVEPSDTIFGIAEKFGLKPETVLWSNRYTLGDTPDGLSIGFELVILPVDGVYHMWNAVEGIIEGLNGVSSYYGVDPDDIVNYPLNNLDPAVVGDYSNPNIPKGTMLIVPGGTRPNVVWAIARDNPAVGASYLGEYYCAVSYGNVGTGTFVFPTDAHYLSGYDWNPPVHNGLDFDGDFGSNIYAADSGVIVYSGWSDRGYGNLIVVDHDDGWQTMYAHLLDGSMMPCGSNVSQGELIALMGSTGRSTGPHLHFELRYQGNAVNPWDYLQ